MKARETSPFAPYCWTKVVRSSVCLRLKAAPPGLDSTKLEQYLADDEFQAVFGIAKADFYGLPQWVQIKRRKEVGLH